MTQANDQHTTAPNAPERRDHPYDTISMNVQKAHGIVAMLKAGLNEDMDLNARDLGNAFWALSDLLWDAAKAMDRLIAEDMAEHDRKTAGGAS